jgi:hypothetical protein
MANRREFLQLSAATLGIMAVPVKTLAGMNPSTSMPFFKVIYDERFEDCQAFAHESRKLGAVTQGIREDITDLWYGDLRGQLAQQPGLIAGLTTASSAFLLELLSHDVFYHQVFRGEHQLNDAQLTAYRIEAPGYIAKHASALQTGGKHWSTDLAELLARYDHSRPSFPRTQVTSTDNFTPSSPDLVSWVIAPLSRG